MAFSDELKSNNAILIAFKAHNHPVLIVEKMVDEKNNLRPFYQFRNSVVHLIGDYDISLLEEEYSFAVRRAHLINDLRQIIREKDVLPNMKWMPSLHPFGCPRHERFWNRIWAVDSPFWLSNLPCDNIDCVCYLSSTDEDETDNSDIGMPHTTQAHSWSDLIGGAVCDDTDREELTEGGFDLRSMVLESIAKAMSQKCNISMKEAREHVTKCFDADVDE